MTAQSIDAYVHAVDSFSFKHLKGSQIFFILYFADTCRSDSFGYAKKEVLGNIAGLTSDVVCCIYNGLIDIKAAILVVV